MQRIDYDVAIPNKGGGRYKRSEEYMKIQEFMKTKHETMRIIYGSPEEALKRYHSLTVTIRRESIPIKVIKSENKLYFKKIKGGSCDELL